ncbi:MAG: TIGR02281 family clan AA aspartic protease [Gammaproteobacteria bacterium]|nr:TIGR02281 family clan AA aspartic protease [Gammaproteobacteria bacterium]
MQQRKSSWGPIVAAGLLWLAIALSFGAVADPGSVRVLALFPGKAMLEIDGKRKVLAAGAPPHAGVRLVSADPARAIVEIGGERQELRLGSAVSATYRKPTRREVRIISDATGSYFVDGLINGQPVRFLVDTGATSVAMSELHAAKLGILHRVEGQRVGVGTASGSTGGFSVNLRTVSVGGLRVTNVDAVVIDGDSPRNVLLGMSVLTEFEMDQRENLLILRARY